MNPALDPAAFAEQVLQRPLWPHQIEFARCTAKFRSVNAGRQVGKSEVLAVTSLFEAATRANIFVLILSAGEAASRRLLATAAQLAARSDLLRGSVMDESKSTIVLSNGSTIMSIPASERQARGWSADVLILDEAAFIGEDIFNAVEPVTIARPGSRIILASTPFSTDHFFYRLWRRGMDAPDARYASFHWPSSISPLISAEDLEDLRKRTNPLIFNREYLAEFTDSQGALLTPEEISKAIVDYDFIEPELVERQGYWKTTNYGAFGSETNYNIPPVVGGIDYGKMQDANALVLLGIVDDNGVNVKEANANHAGDYIFWIPWLEFHYRMNYGTFLDRIVDACTGYHVRTLASELNGPGSYPTEELENLIGRAYRDGRLPLWNGKYSTYVAGVWTDNRRKGQMFGRLKGMLQSGKLILPRHPELLQQLAGLEMVLTASGNTQISVPESHGHDDLVMALGQALASIGDTSRHPQQRYRHRPTDKPAEDFTETSGGLLIPKNLRLLDPDNPRAFVYGSYGEEKEMPW
jgi:hypothetical protein